MLPGCKETGGEGFSCEDEAQSLALVVGGDTLVGGKKKMRREVRVVWWW